MIILQLKVVHFLLIVEEAPPTPNFSLKNLPAASKIDVVARVILALYPKYTQLIDPSLDVVFTHNDPHLLHIKGFNNTTHYDEISIAAEIRELINSENSLLNNNKLINLQAIWLSLRNLDLYLEKTFHNYDCLYYLHETGEPISDKLSQIKKCDSIIFVLGGRQDISSENENKLLNLGMNKISLGEKAYLASSCVTKIIFSLEKILS